VNSTAVGDAMKPPVLTRHIGIAENESVLVLGHAIPAQHQSIRFLITERIQIGSDLGEPPLHFLRHAILRLHETFVWRIHPRFGRAFRPVDGSVVEILLQMNEHQPGEQGAAAP
jgi:hypothetical protein